MTKPARFHPAALAEMTAAATHYQAEREGLGDAFIDAVDEALRLIRSFPAAWQRTGQAAARRFVLERFPFAVVFVEHARVIRVLAVAHTSREPGYWRRRQ